MEFSNNLAELERLDKLKTKVMKFVLYKKRTIQEVKDKFIDEIDENELEDIIEIIKQNGYLDDEDYIERSIKEFKALKNLSIKEINYKLLQKKVDKSLLDDYIYNHREELLDFEIQSAKSIIIKKINQGSEMEDIKKYLYSKGYMNESVKIAKEEIEE